jgi:hypothetical protein
LLSSNIAHLDYVETRAVEMRRAAAQSRLAKHVERTSRPSGSRRSAAA